MVRPPNLLLLMSDQHCYRMAGCYGDKAAQTPNLDRLAARGVVFDACYTTSPICTPARMSLLTGRHPHQQQCWTNDDFLASDLPTYAHALGAAGRRPALVGRLHALGPDQNHGFVTRRVGDHSPNWIGIPRHDMGVLNDANDPHRVSVDRSGSGRSAYQTLDEDTVDGALEELDRLAAEAGDRPFALVVGLMLPHPPYVATPEDFAACAGRIPPARLAPPETEHPWIRWWRTDRGILDVPPADALRARTAYYALVRRMDILLGRILDRLEELGLADDTLVAYTSDHGDHVGERGLWWKHTFYEESVRVPLILSWPNGLPAGERRGNPVSLVDLTATIVDAAGAPALPNAAGRSLMPLARDGAAPWHDEAFAEYGTDSVPAWTGGRAVQQRMLRSGPWKLVFYNDAPVQLFNLHDDPDETADLADTAIHADVRARLLARLLDGWDPEWMRNTMLRRRADKDVIGAWARAVEPPDSIRWELRADQNWLDGIAAA